MANWISAPRLDEFFENLYPRLTLERIFHIQGTAHTALSLAERWGEDVSDTLQAALFHDMAKEQDRPQLWDLVRHSGLELDPDDEHFPNIWHALAAAAEAKRDHDASDRVVRAIQIHPTGDAGMNRLEKIIYFADFTEPNRVFAGASELRRLAREDLDAAVDQAIVLKAQFVQEKGKNLHARSLRALAEVKQRSPEDSDINKKGGQRVS